MRRVATEFEPLGGQRYIVSHCIVLNVFLVLFVVFLFVVDGDRRRTEVRFFAVVLVDWLRWLSRRAVEWDGVYITPS